MPGRFVLGLTGCSGYNTDMILTCPACDAQYILPDESIGPKGRRVKCTTCDYTWLQQPEIVMALDEISFEDAPQSSRESTIPRYDPVSAPRTMSTPIRKTQSNLKPIVNAAIGFAILALLVTIGATVIFRPVLVRNYPSTALLFEQIGLPAPIAGKGIYIVETTADIIKDKDGADVLTVTGKLVNDTDKNIALPRLVIRMTNYKDGWLKDWQDSLYGNSLNAGKSIGFKYELKKVPANGENVTFLFAD